MSEELKPVVICPVCGSARIVERENDYTYGYDVSPVNPEKFYDPQDWPLIGEDVCFYQCLACDFTWGRWNDANKKAVIALRERAEKAEAALPRWIPVEERLPDAGEPVIMWIRPEYIPGPIRGGTYDPASDASHPWHDAWSLKDYKTSEIALWIPLPERPAHDAGKDGENV